MKQILLIFSLLALSFSLKGQTDTTASADSSEVEVMMISANADSAFMQARDLAFKKEYEASRKLLNVLLLEDPDNYEVKIFRLRTFLWQKKHETAREEIGMWLAEDTNAIEVYKLRALNELYDKDYEMCLRYCDDGIKRFPKQNEFFHTQKAQALTSKNELHEALDATNEALKHYPESNELNQLKTFLLNQLIVDGLAVGVYVDYFTKNYNPWLYGFVQYGRQTPIGAVIARLNAAERFQPNTPSFGVQGEIDVYPRITRNSYAYLNVGYSPSQIYPNFRAGAEYFTKVFNTPFEASLGIRYLDFLTNRVVMYTGSLGYYWGNNYAMFRPFVINDITGWGTTYNFLYRRFFSGKGDYFQIIFGGGVVPDERIFFLTNGLAIDDYRLDNQYLGFAYQKLASDRMYTRFELILTRQENFSVQNDYLQIITLGLTVGYRF